MLYLFISSAFAWHNEICLSYFGSEISLPLSLALHVPLVLKIAVPAKQGKVPLCRTVLLRLFKAGSSVWQWELLNMTRAGASAEGLTATDRLLSTLPSGNWILWRLVLHNTLKASSDWKSVLGHSDVYMPRLSSLTEPVVESLGFCRHEHTCSTWERTG